MKENSIKSSSAYRFKRFLNSPYAAFRSLNIRVNIGVLTVASLAFANTGTAFAQSSTHPNQTMEKLYELEEVEVTGSLAPLTLSQSARIVTVLDREAIASAPVQSLNDLLKYAVGVDVRQRGAIGAQTDISIRGGTNEQITILLNGVNICDPQTGHNAFDFPVDISEIERIEVLEGPAGRVYGTSSLLGAINIVTRQEKNTSVDVHTEGGSYGYYTVGGRANYVSGRLNNQVSGSYTRSDGFSRNATGSLNGDYEGGKMFYQGQYEDERMNVRIYAGGSVKGWGSSTSYASPKWKSDEQFEHTSKYFAGIQLATKGWFHVNPTVYFNRNNDRYEGYRGQPERMKYNYNRTSVSGVNLNCYFETSWGKTAFGGEFRNEDLLSGNLGEPFENPTHRIYNTDRYFDHGLNRSNISFHAEHNVLLDRFTLSGGLIAVKNTWNKMNWRFYPGVDASYRIADNLKLYASYNTSLRMPSFTELFYSVGGHKADKYLKPEEMQAFEMGVKYLTPVVRATASVYHHHGKNMIDWIMDSSKGEDAVWESVNHTKINSVGLETNVSVDFTEWFPSQRFLRSASLAYSYIDQDKDLEKNLQSQYALEYLRHKLVAQANLRLCARLFMNVSYRWQDRVGTYQRLSDSAVMPYSPYGLLDARLTWDADRYKLYVEANNLTDKTYVDYGNVPQPGFWFIAGGSYRLDF